MTDLRVVHRTFLPAVAPFEFALSVRAIESFTPTAGDAVVSGRRVRRALLRPPDGAVLLDVGPAPGGVDLVVHAAEPLESPPVVEAAVNDWLSLGDDQAEFLARAEADPPMAPVLAVARGLHQVRFPSLSEAAVYFGLTQRSTTWYARARKRRLAEALGPSLTHEGQTHVAFPSLAAVAELSVDQMIEFAGNKQRAERVLGIVRGLAEIDEGRLRTAPYDEARAALLAVPGIGPFTAYGLLFRALGRPDDVPLEMAQFALAAQALYGDPPPSPSELRAHYGREIGRWAYTVRTALSWLPKPEASATG